MPTPLWKPGQSGNPSGRPKILADVARRIREATNDLQDVIDELRGMVADPTCPRALKIRAMEILLDRALGKPVVTADVLVGTDAPALRQRLNLEGMTDDELRIVAKAFTPAPEIEVSGSPRAPQALPLTATSEKPE